MAMEIFQSIDNGRIKQGLTNCASYGIMKLTMEIGVSIALFEIVNRSDVDWHGNQPRPAQLPGRRIIVRPNKSKEI